jgi:hypothetical protein
MDKIVGLVIAGFAGLLLLGWGLPWIMATPMYSWGYGWNNNMMSGEDMHSGMMDMQGCPMHNGYHDDSHMYNQSMMYEMHEECEAMMGQEMGMHMEHHNGMMSNYSSEHRNGGHC